MSKQTLDLESALEILKTEFLEELSNEDVVEYNIVWENNPFTEEKMRAMLLQDSKESNIEKLNNKLRERYDLYVISYITFSPVFNKNLINLNDDLQAIVQEVFEEFELTNEESKRELNRSQVNNINSDSDLNQAIYDFIDERLVDLVEDDEDIEKLIPTIFAAVMVEMLYSKSSPLSLARYKEILRDLG